MPKKFLPLQNVLIGTISALVCYFSKVEPNLLNSFIICLMGSMSAGGMSDLKDLKKSNDNKYVN